MRELPAFRRKSVHRIASATIAAAAALDVDSPSDTRILCAFVADSRVHQSHRIAIQSTASRRMTRAGSDCAIENNLFNARGSLDMPKASTR